MTIKPPPVLTLTPAAADRIRHLIEHSHPHACGLRIGVRKGGCAGMAYHMDLITEPDPLDDLIEDQGIRLFVDRTATLFLLGTKLDFQTTKLSSTFVFHNPNQVSACGCGESVSLQPAHLDTYSEP